MLRFLSNTWEVSYFCLAHNDPITAPTELNNWELVSRHPRNNDSETKISFQVLINITPINDGGIINDSGIIIKCRKENELVIEVPSVHDKSESSVLNLALSLMVSFILGNRGQKSLFRIAPPFDWKWAHTKTLKSLRTAIQDTLLRLLLTYFLTVKGVNHSWCCALVKMNTTLVKLCVI